MTEYARCAHTEYSKSNGQVCERRCVRPAGHDDMTNESDRRPHFFNNWVLSGRKTVKLSDVNFDTVPFMHAHGTSPRGHGSWAFCPYDKYRSDDYLAHTFFVNGPYGEAKRAAREHFAQQGVTAVVVCT